MRRVETYIEREHRFSRYASHELRTPVTIIKGAVVLLKKKFLWEEDPAYRPLKRIERSVGNMENIIETLLWLSRKDMAIDQNQAFKIVSVVRETIEQHRHLLIKKAIDIELVPESDPQLSIPAPIFQIAFTNLIRNAIQHTAAGKISVIVKDNRVIVTDTGRGMQPDDLKLATQPLVRGDRYNGLGIGISIVKRICERADWKLKFESELGRGTTVHLIFRTAAA